MSGQKLPAAEQAPPSNLQRLASLLTLQRKARRARIETEIAFLLANDTALIAPYRNAVLWLDGRIEAMSSVPEPDRRGAQAQWYAALCRYLAETAAEQKAVMAADVPDHLARDWRHHAPEQILWLRLSGTATRPLGGLLLCRDKSFDDAERQLLGHWAEEAGLALDALHMAESSLLRRFRRSRRGTRSLLVAMVIAILAAAFWPIRLSILAPAEVIPREAQILRSPVNGIVDEVLVAPNSPVKRGAPLIRFDDREIRAKLDVVRQGLESAQAEYRLAQQSAITNREAQASLTILRERIEQRRAEVQQAEQWLERIVVTAEEDGIALLPDAESLKGRPMRIGEKLMIVADPAKVEVEMWIATGDSIALPHDAPVELYLNVAPDRPLEGRLSYVSYQASLSPANVLAFRGTGQLNPGEPLPRIGLRGSAKVYAEKVPLGYYLLRRPVALMREVIGF